VLGYPARCADWLARSAGAHGRALDLGCAVGRASFELSRDFPEVVGIDLSRSFIAAAETLRAEGVFRRSEAGHAPSSDARKIARPAACHPERVRFAVGDACDLPADLGDFDAVLMANLLCRLPDPAACLRGILRHLRPGAVLVITTPCSWDEAYTPRDRWLRPTLAAIRGLLEGDCDLLETREMPFVIREHERRAQYTVAQGSAWRKRSQKP
jgi:putative 4-mercaptohistidine N1-methyltranferase